MTGMKLTAMVAGLAAVGTLGVALAFAATSDTGTINACVDREGTPHIVPAGTSCAKRETTLSWAVQGPQGPAGPQGAKGDQGPAGASGHTLTVIGSMTATKHDGTAIMGGDGTQTTMNVVGFSQEIVSPRDAASGQATGKRQHKPITITKQWDAASPRLMQACATNETLPAVQFLYHAPGSTADTMRVKLIDASCTDFASKTDDSTFELESISFTFRKIEVEHLQSKTMFLDDWTTSS